MLNIVEVHRSFGAEVILSGVSLEVRAGEMTVLAGANGAGKSTLLEIVAGVLDADAGSVCVAGCSITDPRARRALGYAPAAAVLPESLFVHEWIDLAASLRDVGGGQAIDDAVARFGLRELTGARLSALSLGERRRLALTLASLGRPTVLVLDEPTVGLDSPGVSMLGDWLRQHTERGGAVLLASHDLDFAATLGARRLALHRGRIGEAG